MRSTLYVKDEDYRFSYLYGSYVTLTNIDDETIERIIEQQLSPLYVSVHATEEDLRERLIGRKGPAILPLLKRLCESGIQIHTQVVVCPGYNDGEALVRTIEDLYALRPNVLTLAIVPVGLTGYRKRLPDIRPLSSMEAQNALDTIHAFQDRFLAESGSRFVFAADELYLQAGRDFPPLDDYEDLSQIENGVGLVPLFRVEAEDVLEEAGRIQGKDVSVITGESAFEDIRTFVEALSAKTGVRIQVWPVKNRFFGGHVTVTGLLTGADIMEQLRGKDLGSRLLIPDVVLREGDDVFLDDMTLADLGRELGVKVQKIDTSPWGLFDALESGL